MEEQRGAGGWRGLRAPCLLHLWAAVLQLVTPGERPDKSLDEVKVTGKLLEKGK